MGYYEDDEESDIDDSRYDCDWQRREFDRIPGLQLWSHLEVLLCDNISRNHNKEYIGLTELRTLTLQG